MIGCYFSTLGEIQSAWLYCALLTVVDLAPDAAQLMLAYTRQDAFELNQMARNVRHEQSELGPDYEFATDRGLRHFYNQGR